MFYMLDDRVEKKKKKIVLVDSAITSWHEKTPYPVRQIQRQEIHDQCIFISL